MWVPLYHIYCPSNLAFAESHPHHHLPALRLRKSTEQNWEDLDFVHSVLDFVDHFVRSIHGVLLGILGNLVTLAVVVVSQLLKLARLVALIKPQTRTNNAELISN